MGAAVPVPTSPVQGGTDIAALSAGIVAVAVSLFVAPGSYGPINLVFSITLLSVIAGYVWPHHRGPLQSLAISAAAGLAAIPAIGFFDEAFRSRDLFSFLLTAYDWNCELGDPCKDGDDRSRVQDRDLA
jgi:hypothetical protein